MRVLMYFWADGPSFDPDRFWRLSKGSVTGEVCQRKRLSEDGSVMYLPYWRSKQLASNGLLQADQITKFVRDHLEILQRARDESATRLFLAVALMYSEGEPPSGGLFLEHDAVTALSAAGVAVDIDAGLAVD